MAKHIGAVGSEREPHRIWAPANEDPDQEGSANPSTNAKHKLCYCLGVIREIEIWRVAVLMVNRYAADAKLNSLRRAAELTVDGDHARAAIWRRITIAIEQLTDTTGLLTDNGSI
jgi:hypothetical protein